MITNKLYDFLKWFAIVGLHALGVAYGQLADIWGLPYGQAIPETLDIIGVVLGAFLAWESYQYNKQFEVFSAPKVQPVEDATDIQDELEATIQAEDIE